jgi:hypothetical protein
LVLLEEFVLFYNCEHLYDIMKPFGKC